MKRIYAITDLETTGGNPLRSRITEIAIYFTDGTNVLDKYVSLVNPEQAIPYNITKITGINDGMVADAPTFEQLAKTVYSKLKSCVFIAHNVNFDYGFLKEAFARCDIAFNPPRACTVRLARKVFVNQPSYSLGRLCSNLGIELNGRHRAWGDAKATTELFHRMFAQSEFESIIAGFLKKNSGEYTLPPNIRKEDFEAIPNAKGIYVFRDEQKKIVYIGKAKKLKTRVKSHFYGSTNTKDRHYFLENIHSLEIELIEDDLILDIREAELIKKYWPRYNRALKKFNLNYGIFHYIDQLGRGRFAVAKCGKNQQPEISFRTKHECDVFLLNVCEQFALDPQLCNLPQSAVWEVNIQGYQEQFNAALRHINKLANNLLIFGKAKEVSKQSVVLIEKGRYKGYGFVDKSMDCNNVEALKKCLTAAYDDQDMRAIVQAYINEPGRSVKLLKSE